MDGWYSIFIHHAAPATKLAVVDRLDRPGVELRITFPRYAQPLRVQERICNGSRIISEALPRSQNKAHPFRGRKTQEFLFKFCGTSHRYILNHSPLQTIAAIVDKSTRFSASWRPRVHGWSWRAFSRWLECPPPDSPFAATLFHRVPQIEIHKPGGRCLRSRQRRTIVGNGRGSA